MTKGKILLLAGKVLLVIAAYYSKKVIYSVLIKIEILIFFHFSWHYLYFLPRNSLTFRVEYIAERFFSCHPKLEVMTAAWHPGSIDDNHIVILASDNYLR